MKNPITKKIIDHLDFLGYKVEDVSGESEIDIVEALSEIKSNLLLKIFKNNVILISARYKISDSNSIVTLPFLQAINSENFKSLYSKVYYVEEQDKKILLGVESVTMDYNKMAFVTVIDSFEKEAQGYLRDLKKYYSPVLTAEFNQSNTTASNRASKNKKEELSRIGF